MDPTQPGMAPPSGLPRDHNPGQTQKLPGNQSATSGSKRWRAVRNRSTHEPLGKYTDNNDTAGTVRLRSGLLDISQPPPMTGTNQRYQRPRRDSLDSLYSGAIEGCSRDHHPECYPELWQKVNQPTINGHEEDRNVTDPGRQPRPPPPPPVTPSNRTSSSSNSTNRSGGYKVWLIPNFSRKLLHKAGAEKEAAANKPSRKGKESPLTMEDRMFLMGIRRRRPEDAHEKEPSHPPPPAGTASSSAKRPVIGGFVTYPQIGGVHDPSRASGSPLVVANPDPGSKAERVRDDAVRDQRVPRTGHRSSSARSKTKTKTKAKAKGSSRGIQTAKRS